MYKNAKLNIFQNNKIFRILRIILLFFTVYNSSSLTRFTFISTSRISLCIIILCLLINWKFVVPIEKNEITKIIKHNWIFQLVLLIYELFVLFFNDVGTGQNLIGFIVNYLIFVPLTVLAFSSIYDDVENLLRDLVIITLIQAFIMLICMMNSDFAAIIDNVFNKGIIINANRDYEVMRKQGYNGGIACITSTGSLKMGLGIIGCCYGMIKQKNMLFYYISLIVITVSSLTASRTAIVITGVLLFMTVLYFVKNHNIGFVRFILISLLILVICIFVILPRVSNYLPKIFSRVYELMEKGIRAGFLDGYIAADSSSVPSLSLHMLLGTGIVSGYAGNGEFINVDGNIRRLYSAIGLPMSIVFYFVVIVSMLNCLKHVSDKKVKFAGSLFFLILLIGEFKEPFFYSLYFIELFYVFVILAIKKDEGCCNLFENDTIMKKRELYETRT